MKPLLLLAFFLSPVALHAQASRSAPTPFARASGAFFAISVADLAASARWYSEKLGLNVTMRAAPTDRMELAVLEGGGMLVELIQDRDAVRSPTSAGAANPTAVHGIFKAGLIVEDLGAALAVLRSRGVAIAFGPCAATPTQRSNAIFRDNSGNLIRLVEVFRDNTIGRAF